MKVILPVAGKGERMRPYTGNPPKCLLPVSGKTIIGRIVEDALLLGPTETPFITGYKAEALDGFLKRRPGRGRTRTVLQSDPQGLGQATSQDIRRAFPCCAGSGSRGIKLRPHAAIFPPRGPSAGHRRPSRPYGLRSLTQTREHNECFAKK